MLGDISARNMAIPRLRGTPMRRAIAEVTMVPSRYGSAPNTSLPDTGFHLTSVKKPAPNL